MELKICTVSTVAGLGVAALMLVAVAWAPAARVSWAEIASADVIDVCPMSADGSAIAMSSGSGSCITTLNASIAESAAGVSVASIETAGASVAAATEGAAGLSVTSLEASGVSVQGIVEGPGRSAYPDNYSDILP